MDTAKTNLPAKQIKRTSLNVDGALWAQMKIAAIQRGLTTGDAVERAIELWVRSGEQSGAGRAA